MCDSPFTAFELVGVTDDRPGRMSVSDKELAWLLFEMHGALLRASEQAHRGTFPHDKRLALAELLDELSTQLRRLPTAVINQPIPRRIEGRHHCE